MKVYNAAASLIHIATTLTLSAIISSTGNYQDFSGSFWYLLALSTWGVYRLPTWLSIPGIGIGTWLIVAGLSPAKFELAKATLMFVIGV